jgi:hypothetical protein
LAALPNLALVVEAVMAFTAAEMALLWAWNRYSGRGLQPADYALSLLSGLLLMGALRAVLTDGAPGWALAWLAASGLCHALDLRLRWLRAQAAASSADLQSKGSG